MTVDEKKPNRRVALKVVGATLGAGAFAYAARPLAHWAAGLSLDEVLRKHYKELAKDELATIMRAIEAQTLAEHGVEVHVEDYPAQEHVSFGYALNLSTCIGCRKCAEACHEENNHDRRTNNSYIRVLEMEQGSFDMGKGTVDYDHAVPAPGKYYMPVQCHQCDDAPCVTVCPVEATWKEKDSSGSATAPRTARIWTSKAPGRSPRKRSRRCDTRVSARIRSRGSSTLSATRSSSAASFAFSSATS
jgi:ferredoxin